MSFYKLSEFELQITIVRRFFWFNGRWIFSDAWTIWCNLNFDNHLSRIKYWCIVHYALKKLAPQITILFALKHFIVYYYCCRFSSSASIEWMETGQHFNHRLGGNLEISHLHICMSIPYGIQQRDGKGQFRILSASEFQENSLGLFRVGYRTQYTCDPTSCSIAAWTIAKHLLQTIL